MFPKHKWIKFEYEAEIYGDTYLVCAQGWIGSEEPGYETRVEIRAVYKIIEEAIKPEPHIPAGTELLAIDSDALDYFRVNFVGNS